LDRGCIFWVLSSFIYKIFEECIGSVLEMTKIFAILGSHIIKPDLRQTLCTAPLGQYLWVTRVPTGVFVELVTPIVT
jgi:hypothetical protein